MNKVVVITGVAGMTGSKTSEYLLKQGYRVVGCDNFFCGSRDVVSELEKHDNFKFFEYDINNKSQMDEMYSFVSDNYGNFEKYFINCAAVVHTKHFYHPDSTFTTNVVSMKDLLDRCVENSFKSYINCSTSEVYSMKSWVEGGCREEDAILLATAEQSLRTSYATGKLLTEFFMKDAVEKGLIKGCSIRFANVYSPDEVFSDHIIPHIIDSISKNNKVLLLENAKETKRTFLNNHDSCMAVICLLQNENCLDGGIYNVGTQEEISIVDLVKLIAKLMNKEDVEIEFQGYRTADPKRRLLNVSKIRERAGWKDEIALKQGLMECIKKKKKKEVLL